MRVPVWLTLGIAVIVMIFGGYRLWLATRPVPAQPATSGRRGFYGMSKKAHLFIGLMYVLLGAALIATSLGFNPLSDALGPDTVTPPKSEAPSGYKTIPIDQLPKP